MVTAEEVAASVAALLASKAAELEKDRYRLQATLIKEGQKNLKWANPLEVKKEVEAQILKLLGPKDERDDPKLLKKVSYRLGLQFLRDRPILLMSCIAEKRAARLFGEDGGEEGGCKCKCPDQITDSRSGFEL